MKQWLLIALALLLGACNTTPSELDDLEKVLRAYEHSMRWSRLELAVQYYKDPPELSERQKKRLRDIKVTDYKVLTINASTTEAVQAVEMRYYNTNNHVVREITDTQTWEYDKETERWALTSKFPEFK
ncbi:MAG: hypothetical protein RI563_09840 [Thiohalophilus sp.]|uniref:hypothetical protein n=1 Tax=Thiohalophilus sp. TaxID=3028392 RepID=UPI00287057A0|nr:hypothetical protein [Thiohalophilus sp.]MDR9437175.1 hypothetical protein [Thiohalophilus sp.]